MTAVVVLLLSVGCAGAPGVEFSTSASQPIVSYVRTVALPPEYSPTSPEFIVYGDGTAYRREGRMSYFKGTMTPVQIKTLAQSIVDKGFFTMSRTTSRMLPGGAVDHVTLTLKSRSSSVERPSDTGGAFGQIVREVQDYRIPGEKEYLPDRITLYATEAAPGEQVDKVIDWTADPGPLVAAANAHSSVTVGTQVTGVQAQQVWKLLAGASGEKGTVGWRAGGKTYVHVYADPFFPAPGV